MKVARIVAAIAISLAGAMADAQQTSQIELKIEPSNRTLTVSADARVTVEPEIAVLHIGFETQPMEAKAAYAEGAKLSNQIIGAIKQAGIDESAIRGESQRLAPWDTKNHKFRLSQNWVVKVPPQRAAEILDIAVTAGALDSGQIEWTVNDEKALEDQALQQAAARARSDANVMAASMGARLGALTYVTNHVSGIVEMPLNGRNFSQLVTLSEGVEKQKAGAQVAPLAIEPHKVSRTASVYAVFAIE